MTESQGAAPRMKTSLRVVLIVSLALNLAVAGLALGVVLSHRGESHRHGPGAMQSGGPLVAALEQGDRRAVGRDLRAALRGEGRGRNTRRDGYAAVIAALTAEPYDGAVMRDAVQAQMQQFTRRMDLGGAALIRRLDKMSTAERAAYARRLQDMLERRTRARNAGPKG